jgi:hypothetical protein
MRNNMLYGKKAQIFGLMIVLVVSIVCGYAFFKFLTTSRGFEGVLVAPSSTLKLYSNTKEFEFFTEEAAKLAVIQAYRDIANEGDFAADSCLQQDYVEFCELAPNIDERFASKIKSNFQAFLLHYEDDEFRNKFSQINYKFEVNRDTIKANSDEEELHMLVQEGRFPYSVRYKFNHEISLSLDELGLTDFFKIYDKLISCKSKEDLNEIESCMQEIKNFDVKISKLGKKILFNLTSRKKFFFESRGKPVYEKIEMDFIS